MATKKKKRESQAERYKRVIRQRRIFVISVFCILVLLCVCLFTPIFGISNIEVSGNSILSAEDIISASGIEKGENVFRVNTKKAEKGISELAYVEGVSIKRRFPARLRIEIDEAQPDIIIDTPDEFLVSTISGRVLEKTDDVTDLTVPLVFGLRVTWSEVAHKVSTADEELLNTHLENIATFFHTEHWQNIDSFDVSELSNFMMTMKTGMKVTFGTIESTEGLQRKIKMMSTILPQIEQTERSYLDLTTDKGYYGQYSWAEYEKMREEEAERRAQEAEEEKDKNKEEEQEPLEEIDGDDSDEEEETSEKKEKEKEKEDNDASDEEETNERKKAVKSEKPKEESESEKTEESESSENESESSTSSDSDKEKSDDTEEEDSTQETSSDEA